MKQRRYTAKAKSRSASSKGRLVTVNEDTTLLPFLFELLKEQSKSSVKSILANRQISVNGRTTTQFDTLLRSGDEVRISFQRGREDFRHPMLRLVWEDDSLIVVDKRNGLLSMATDKIKEKTAYHLLSDYVKKLDPANKIFILHRLDRDTSGLMMFAKTRKAQQILQSNWNEMITERSYVAVVEGKPAKEMDLLTSFLVENSAMKVYVSTQGDGQEAITRYKVLKSTNQYSLLQLDLETGRKNQIRAQLESIGHPIAGDVKYGAASNPAGRLALHARKLCFIHPETGEELRFETAIPSIFNAIVKQ